MLISQAAQTTPSTDWGTIILGSIVLPVIVALVTSLIVNQQKENGRRKNSSRLGIAIIETLQEEIGTGIDLMTKALIAANEKKASLIPNGYLPNESWSGMATIPDDVLLRIRETSKNRQFEPFQPKDCRSHCKNYFKNICKTYNTYLDDAIGRAQQGQDWSATLRALLADDGPSHFIQAAKGVQKMLEDAKQLLEANTKTMFPK